MILRRNKRETSTVQFIAKCIAFILLVAYSFILLYPFLWGLVCSFMDDTNFYASFGKFFPKIENFTLKNYSLALDTEVVVRTSGGLIVRYGITDMIGTTLFMTIMRSLIGMAFSVASAYCVSKYKFFGSKFYFYYGVVFCSVPIYGGVSATFNLFHALGMYDTIFSIMFMSITPYSNFLFYFGFFNSISWEYAEAAFMDGANHFQVFIKIMLPQIVPVLFTFLVIAFIGNWNDWWTNYLYLPSRPMIAYGLYKITTQLATGEGSVGWTTYFAASFLSLLVTGAFFGVFSKRILSTVYTGGLKG